MILRWGTFIAILGWVGPVGHGLDTLLHDLVFAGFANFNF